MKTLNEVAENYFSTLNPIAERISTDILAIKEAYEDLWKSLSAKERNQIINETVVHPEALLKYALSSGQCDENADIPIETLVTGSKYIVDENTGFTWRDEHSAPFSWKTPSQIDLSIFSSSSRDVTDGSFIISNASKLSQNLLESAQREKHVDLNISNINSTWSDIEKSHEGQNSLSPESNVVMVGTCSKLSGLCSKFKFLPSKSYSYEVQTMVTNPASGGGGGDASFLDRLRSTAVLKLQNTLRFVGGKAGEKKVADSYDTQTLVQGKGAPTVVKISSVSPKVSKPKSPPPPPPPVLSLRNDKEYSGTDTEKATLLDDSQERSLTNFSDLDRMDDEDADDDEIKVVHEMSEDFSTDCTPVTSGPTTEVIPKSGFDFLDNW